MTEDATGSGTSSRPLNGTVALLFILSGGLALGGLALLGLPGALLLKLASPVAALFTDHRVSGDGGWPMAIIQTILWPWVPPPAYLLAARGEAPGRWRALATIGYALAGGVLIGVIMQIVAGRL